jgi:hypothetical protein
MFGIVSSSNFHKYTEHGVDCPTSLTLVMTMMCVIVGYTGYLYVIFFFSQDVAISPKTFSNSIDSHC